MMMIVTTEGGKRTLEKYIGTMLPGLPNPEKIFSPSMAEFYGIGVHVLPEEAFEGMTDEDGEPANMIFVNGRAWTEQVVKHWDSLKDGSINLRHVEQRGNDDG